MGFNYDEKDKNMIYKVSHYALFCSSYSSLYLSRFGAVAPMNMFWVYVLVLILCIYVDFVDSL